MTAERSDEKQVREKESSGTGSLKGKTKTGIYKKRKRGCLVRRIPSEVKRAINKGAPRRTVKRGINVRTKLPVLLQIAQKSVDGRNRSMPNLIGRVQDLLVILCRPRDF